MSDLPLVSVVVLNYNGRRHLEACFRSLRELDYPRQRLELILVDNASTDGSIEFMAKHFPEVRLIRNESNVGFARGNNIGAEAAQGQYVAFLNNDTRVDAAWLRELVHPLLRDQSVVCTASKMVDWEGRTVDFARGVMNFYGHGHQKDFGQKNLGSEREEPILFPCGGSMLIDRAVFLETGGFDGDYFIYFEDVDLGWRLWLMGYQVIMVPTAITYHRHHATMNQFYDYRQTVLYERNALYTIIKNYGQETLDRVLPVALLLVARRIKEFMAMDGVDFAAYHITSPEASTGEAESVSRLSLAPLVALNEVIENLPILLRKREQVQRRRRRSDSEILALFGQPFRPALPITAANAASQYTLAQEFGIAQLFEDLPRRVLVLSRELGKGDVSEPLPNGDRPPDDGASQPWKLCQALEQRGHQALLASPQRAGSDWAVPLWDSQPLVRLVHQIAPDVVVACQAEALRELADCAIPLVFYRPPYHGGGWEGGHLTSLGNLSDLTINGSVEEIIECLDQFCRRPIMRREPRPRERGAERSKSFGTLLGEAWRHYRRGGVRVLVKETRGFLRRRWRR